MRALHSTRFLQVSGRGLALAAVVIEQDAAYWEVHVVDDKQQEEGTDGENGNSSNSSSVVVEAVFGVATKKDRKFYAALLEELETAEGQGK